MPNKHFCQGPTCHEQTTQDRFLKSRGVVRGRYANATLDQQYEWGGDKFFCSQSCKFNWLSVNMTNIEQGRPIEFIRHRRESQGYHKIHNDDRWGGEYQIQRVDNGQIVE